MKKFLVCLCMCGASVLSLSSGYAETVNVSASPSTIAQAIGNATLSNRPNDWIVGAFSSQGRFMGVAFDESPYLALAQDPTTTLLSAELVLTENGRNNTNSSNSLFAFFSTEENTGWDVGMANVGNQGASSGTTGFFGNTAFRAGPFGGGSGPDNMDNLQTAEASQAFAFTSATGESMTIDLASGISLADIKSILADDDTNNAGIFLRSDATEQVFFDDNFQLNLTFETVPEPSSMILLGLGSVFVGLRRRRS